MPGSRDYFAERARHATLVPEKQRTLYQTLTAQLPQHERALVGRERILAFLTQLGLTRRNGTPLTWRMVLRWHRDLHFPLVRGVWHPSTPLHPSSRSPSLTTTYAVTAWVLTQFSTDSQGLFRVGHPLPAEGEGSRPACLMPRNAATPSARGIRPAFLMPRNADVSSARGIGKGRWVRPFAVIRLADSDTDRTRTQL
jgi:hypothetical protein